MSFGDDTLDPQNAVDNLRYEALSDATVTLTNITGSHNRTPFVEGSVIGPCECRSCIVLLKLKSALETYK